MLWLDLLKYPGVDQGCEHFTGFVGADICWYWKEIIVVVEDCVFVRAINVEIELVLVGVEPGISWSIGENISVE